MRAAAATAAKGASWMSLVAATTLGLGQVDQVRALVSAESELSGGAGDYRLIVQSYSKDSLASDSLPSEYARPSASVQRAVTAEELARGIDVRMVELGELTRADRVVVAWVEQGQPDLELDARRARPGKGAYYGVADGRSSADVRIVLRKQV